MATITCTARQAQGFLQVPVVPTSCPRISTQQGLSRTPLCQKRERSMHPSKATDLDKSAEYVKAELERVQAEYEVNRKAKIAEQTRKAAAAGEATVTPLSELDFIPYINEDGKITDLEVGKGVRASVYAIYDEAKVMQYVGVSRGVQQSLRLHLARCPEKTYFLKVQHITQPSRSLLEIIRDSWVEENGSNPDGNDGAENQSAWESALNVVPLMNEEDKEVVEGYKFKGKIEMGMKKVARRFQAEKEEILKNRGIIEDIRFDPKLKGKGLLDVESNKPDTTIPTK